MAAIFVVNRFTVNLRPGWNLVSTPLMLTNPDMDAVLSHLVIARHCEICLHREERERR